MKGAAQHRKYVLLTEALSWIAYRTLLDGEGIKALLQTDPACLSMLEQAAQQFSLAAAEGRLRARGRSAHKVDPDDHATAAYIDDMHEDRFRDFEQFDLDLDRLQYRPAGGSRVIGTWGIPINARAPDGSVRSTVSLMGTAKESFERTFQSLAGVTEDSLPSYAAGYEAVEVLQADLLLEFPPAPKQPPGVRKTKPREIDYDAVRARARELLEERPNLSIGSAAASLVLEIPKNPKTGKTRDTRGVERIIAPLWEGGEDN